MPGAGELRKKLGEITIKKLKGAALKKALDVLKDVGSKKKGK